MPRARCDLCGRPATVHETLIEKGRAFARHRCRDHGLAAWRDALARDKTRPGPNPDPEPDPDAGAVRDEPRWKSEEIRRPRGE